MAKVRRSESLKGVKVQSLDLLLDDIMATVPRQVIDLSTDGSRARVRDWLKRIGRHIAIEVGEEMAEASAKAARESAALFINPSHYEDKKKRREKRRIERLMKQADAGKIKAFGKTQFIQ